MVVSCSLTQRGALFPNSSFAGNLKRIVGGSRSASFLSAADALAGRFCKRKDRNEFCRLIKSEAVSVIAEIQESRSFSELYQH